MELARYLQIVLKELDGNRVLTVGALREIIKDSERLKRVNLCSCSACKDETE